MKAFRPYVQRRSVSRQVKEAQPRAWREGNSVEVSMILRGAAVEDFSRWCRVHVSWLERNRGRERGAFHVDSENNQMPERRLGDLRRTCTGRLI